MNARKTPSIAAVFSVAIILGSMMEAGAQDAPVCFTPEGDGVTLADMTTYDESYAVDGRWPLALDGADFVDGQIDTWRWICEEDLHDFEGGDDAGWGREEGTWIMESGDPLSGGVSYRQTSTNLSRTRNLFGQIYEGRLEIEVTVRMHSANEEIHLLFGGQGINQNYEVTLRGRGYDDVLLSRRMRNSNSTLVDFNLSGVHPAYPIEQEQDYRLKVIHDGDEIDVYLDGIWLFKARDSELGRGQVGLSTYRTVATFDDLAVRVVDDEPVAHCTFDEGVHFVRLEVEDGLGQQAEGIVPIRTVAGQPPVAATSGPYTVDEITGDARQQAFTVTLDGGASSDPEGGALRYLWDLGVETFEGPLVKGRWKYASAGVSQDGALAVTGASSWGNRYAFTQQTFPRVSGQLFQATVQGTGNAMLGWKNTSTSGHYNQYAHALYFASGNWYVYEAGAQRANLGGYDRNAAWEVQIELKDVQGAIYRVRQAGQVEWRQIFESFQRTDALLTKGIDVNSGTFTLDDWLDTAVGPNPTVEVYGVGARAVRLTVLDGAGNADTAVTSVTTVPNDPPVADVGPDLTFDERDAYLGRWTLTLNASASSDDHGIDEIEWDYSYDVAAGFQPSGDTGARPSHTFDGPAAHTVAARVTDHAGQQTVDSQIITLTNGAPPVAVAGGPYSFDEFTGDAQGGGYLVQLDGTASSDAESDLVWQWSLSPDTFEGDVWASSKWHHSANAAQVEGGVAITGTSSWGAQYLLTQDTLPRVEGTELIMRVNVSGGRHMVGFNRSATNFSYTYFPYAVYFNNTTLQIYENGASRGSVGNYQTNVDYDVRIVLRPGTGAAYYIRRADEAAWTLLYESTQYNYANLFRGATTLDGTLTVRSMQDVIGGATPSWRVYGLGQHTVSLAVRDQGNQAADSLTSLTLLANEPPVADAGPDQVLPETAGTEGRFEVALDASGGGDDKGVYRYEWDLDYDGVTFEVDATGAAPAVSMFGPGTRTVALRLVDHALQGDFDTLDIVLGLGDAPVANAGQRVVTEGRLPPALDGRGSTDDVAVERYQWAFGDGRTGVGAQPRHIYWANGEYEATLTVLDASGKSDTDTVIVDVITGAQPVADAGGPYTAAPGGKPAYLDGRSSTDDYGVINYWWDTDDAVDSDGDGVFNNDRDLQGPRPMASYAAAGEYTVTLTAVDGAGQTSTSTALVVVEDIHGPDVICVPWRGNDALARHEIINGRATRLKGIARAAGALTYQWDFGDGSAPTAVQAVSNARIIEAAHTYPDSQENTPYTATLRVWDAQGRVGEDQYHLIVKPDDLDTRTHVSIDEGLWYLHRIQEAAGSWTGRGYRASPTASALQAFLINGHTLDGDHTENPYAEDVYRGFLQLTSRLRSRNIDMENAGNPDSNGNGYGIEVTEREPIYQGGMVMDAIASTSMPLWVAQTGPAEVKGRFLHEIMTDMVDMYAWGQEESGAGRGGWRYSWDSGADNSACQWGAIGLEAAESNFDVNIPAWVKSENQIWLNYSHNGTGFGYSSAGNTANATPSGMVQLAFSGVRRWDTRWQAAEQEMTRRWLWQRNDYYGMFALVKSFRLAKPTPVDLLSDGLDWYSDPDRGVRKYLTDDMATSGTNWGSWDRGSWGQRMLHTSWSIIMLTPTLFVQPPVADAGDDIVWAYGEPLDFDASRSFHTDPIRSLTLYEWDFDGDGEYDLATQDPRDPRAVFTYADPNPDTEGDAATIIEVRLRVTDNNVPPQTDVDIRRITVAEPPHAPFARAGGPYTVTAGIPFTLDGGASFDLDPGDSVSEYLWDLDSDGRFFDDVDLTTDQARASFVFAQPGRYDVALKVRDRGVFNPVGCTVGVDCNPLESAPDFTTVVVLGNLPPLADDGGPYTLNEGEAVRLDASASSDPNGDALIYAWDLGADGTVDHDTETVEITFGDDAEIDVALTVSDTLLSSRSDTTITVLNVAPAVSAGPDVVQPNGLRIVSVGAFVDPGADTWAATVDYGDGAGPQPLSLGADKGFALDHTYAAAGAYTVTVTVTDDDGGVGVDTARFEVTNTQPVVQIADAAEVVEGAALDLQGRFVDPDANVWSATVDYDDGLGARPLALGADKSFSLSTVYPDDGQHLIRVVVSDGAGGQGVATVAVTVTNAVPVVDAGDDMEVTEGATLILDGTFADPGADTWTATVDYGGEEGEVELDLDPEGFQLVYDYPDDGEYTVTVTVTDDDGGVGVDTFTVTVVNAEPAVVAGADQVIDEGSLYQSEGVFTDPGADTWVATVDYGDGGAEAPLALGDDNSFALAHTYLDDGEYTVTVTVTDDDGGMGFDTPFVTVRNVAPIIEAPAGAIIAEGDLYAAAGAFSDPGADDWMATVDYGDGAGPEPLSLADDKTFALAHTYLDDGLYTITVTVADDDGGLDVAEIAVTVENVAPTVEGPEALAGDEGAPLTAAGAFSDPGADTWAATVDYGDGAGPVALPLAEDKTYALAHTYGDNGEYTITVTVTDDDGGVGAHTFIATVANVAPAVDAGEDVILTEGEPLEIAGVFTDPGADTWAATVDYGDGAGPVELPLDEQTFGLSHVYGDDGEYTITVTVTDDDGGVGVDTFAVSVGNVTPVISLTDAVTLDEGGALAVTGDFVDPGLDTWTATVDYDDGVGPVELPLDGQRFTLDHSYLDDGVHTITVRVTDDDGAQAEAQVQVTVLNVAPKVDEAEAQILECAVPTTVAVGYSDPGALDTHTAVFDWGDGSDREDGEIDGEAHEASGAHTWAATGEYTITSTVTDDDGGEGEGTVAITVQDTTAPTLTCGGDLTVEADGACLGAASPTATAVDTCFGDVTLSDDAPDQWPLGETAVRFTATDEAGNLATCQSVVTVVDVTAPTAVADVDPLELEANAECVATTTLDGRRSTDNCNIADYSWREEGELLAVGAVVEASLTGVGAHPITLTICDAAAHCDDATVVAEIVGAQMSCAAVDKADLNMPRGLSRGHRHGRGCDYGDDHDGAHLDLDGTFVYSPCSLPDLTEEAVEIHIDDQIYAVPVGGLRPVGRSGKFKYSHQPRRSRHWWSLELWPARGTWSFKTQHTTTDGLMPADGLSVALVFGTQRAAEDVPVAAYGRDDHRWKYRAPRGALCDPEPRACGHHYDCDCKADEDRDDRHDEDRDDRNDEDRDDCNDEDRDDRNDEDRDDRNDEDRDDRNDEDRDDRNDERRRGK